MPKNILSVEQQFQFTTLTLSFLKKLFLFTGSILEMDVNVHKISI